MPELIFLLFTLLTLGSAVAILLTRNVMYAAFFLLLTLLGVAGLFVLAGADFLAVAQIMIYVGGVLVLIMFGVMLTQNKSAQPVEASKPNYILTGNRSWIVAIGVAIGLFSVLYSVLVRANFVLFNRQAVWQPTPQLIGQQLMTEFSLPFELAGILLLVALIGAATIAASARTDKS